VVDCADVVDRVDAAFTAVLEELPAVVSEVAVLDGEAARLSSCK